MPHNVITLVKKVVDLHNVLRTLHADLCSAIRSFKSCSCPWQLGTRQCTTWSTWAESHKFVPQSTYGAPTLSERYLRTLRRQLFVSGVQTREFTGFFHSLTFKVAQLHILRNLSLMSSTGSFSRFPLFFCLFSPFPLITSNTRKMNRKSFSVFFLSIFRRLFLFQPLQYPTVKSDFVNLCSPRPAGTGADVTHR